MSTDSECGRTGKARAIASAPIRILVVDNSAFMRQMVTQILSAAADFEVVGTARDGCEALQKVPILQPDVITLDVEMPRMDGLAFLEALMPTRPMPVVMISSKTTAGAEMTLACLQRGAVDFVQKPSDSLCLSRTEYGQEIVTKVRSAARARVRTLRTPPPAETAATRLPGLALEAQKPVTPPGNPKMALVAIAASTGSGGLARTGPAPACGAPCRLSDCAASSGRLRAFAGRTLKSSGDTDGARSPNG